MSWLQEKLAPLAMRPAMGANHSRFAQDLRAGG